MRTFTIIILTTTTPAVVLHEYVYKRTRTWGVLTCDRMKKSRTMTSPHGEITCCMTAVLLITTSRQEEGHREGQTTWVYVRYDSFPDKFCTS